ncbi:hypothetical protein CcCBS67573_g08107 [Chytriomyces confervae]|uniref:Calcium-transporting ATPase 2 n=1 Tax=Chytriomyces confervae TaxID=246404 RepID=A0A507EQG6_9FUNG|nr:hypothetical protein CcCBS67573_g08107 [Chytriomyces confervae]
MQEKPNSPSSSASAKQPFSMTRADLGGLVHPTKSPEHLQSLGGCTQVLKALCVDPNVGIRAAPKMEKSGTIRGVKKDGAAQKPAPSQPPTQIVIDSQNPSEEERLLCFGPNRLPPARRITIFEYMLAALGDKIMILLSCVSMISLALGLYQDFGPQAEPNVAKIHWLEGFSILVAVILIVFAASMNDLQKEKKFRKLNDKKEDRYIKGIRNGETQLISIYDILVGDVLLLEPGDILAADGVLISGMGLKCDESSATGESDTIKKTPTTDPILLSGSQVTEGIGKYVVTNVGVDSFYGKILMAMRTEMEDTPLQIKLDGLAERIAKFGAAGAVFMFIILLVKYVISVMKSNGFGDASNQESGTEVANQILKIIMQSVAVIAIAVPEGLPLAVTLALAYATTRMMSDNCLVRVISACETMGNATTICSDKTGTLTQNRMTVVAGVIGKNVGFEGDNEGIRLVQRIKALASENSANPDVPISHVKTKLPGFSGDALLARIMEGISFNSSVFESKDPTGKETIVGSKTETALVEWVGKCGLDYKAIKASPEVSVVQVLPFASERKIMATILKITKPDVPPVYRIHVKGASEIVLKSCDRISLLPFSPAHDLVGAEEANASNHGSMNNGLCIRTNSEHSVLRHPDAVPAVGSRSNPASPLLYPLDAKLRRDCAEKIERFAQKSLRTICLAFGEFSEQEFDALLQGPGLAKVREIRAMEAAAKNGQNTPIVEDLVNEQHAGLGANLMRPVHEIGETKSFESLPRAAFTEADISCADILSYPAVFSEVFAQNLICAAIVGIEDPLRPGVEEAVRTCQRAGVYVRMVTGDNLTTAISIAKKCGIYNKEFGGIAMEGSKFRQMQPHERDEILPRLQVLARSSPTDKQLLVASLKKLGDIVAVTGDGTNDGPALKLANIGFSMGIAGTEVAKEASSIILMDDSFASVVKAIVWGRCVNDSVKKFLQFQLSVNISAMTITLISSIMDASETAVLTVVQLLWVNLIIDTLAALALGTEKPMNDVLDRPPETRTAPLISFLMWKMILGQAFLQVIVNLSLLFGGAQFFQFNALIDEGGILGINSSASPLALEQRLLLRTIVFNTFVLMLIFNQVKRINGSLNIFSGILENPYFGCIFIGVCCMQAIIIQFGGVAFQTTPLNGSQWAFCLIVGFTSIPWGLIIRLVPTEFATQAASNSVSYQQQLKPPHLEQGKLDQHDYDSNPVKVSRQSSLTQPSIGQQPQSLSRRISLEGLKEDDVKLTNKTASSPNMTSSTDLARNYSTNRRSQGDNREMSLSAATKKSMPDITINSTRLSQPVSLDGGTTGGQTQVFSLLRGQSRRRSAAAANVRHNSADTVPPIPSMNPRSSKLT